MTEQSPETKQKIFFTSDLHFGHENVLRFDIQTQDTARKPLTGFPR